MGFFDKVKEIINENDNDDFDDYYDDAPAFDDGLQKPQRSRHSSYEKSSRYDDGYDRDERPIEKAYCRQKGDKVVNIHTTAQLQVVLVKPEGYEEAPTIADNLNEKEPLFLILKAQTGMLQDAFLTSLQVLPMQTTDRLSVLQIQPISLHLIMLTLWGT